MRFICGPFVIGTEWLWAWIGPRTTGQWIASYEMYPFALPQDSHLKYEEHYKFNLQTAFQFSFDGCMHNFWSAAVGAFWTWWNFRPRRIELCSLCFSKKGWLTVHMHNGLNQGQIWIWFFLEFFLEFFRLFRIFWDIKKLFKDFLLWTFCLFACLPFLERSSRNFTDICGFFETFCFRFSPLCTP
jgi:hypothetical protein